MFKLNYIYNCRGLLQILCRSRATTVGSVFDQYVLSAMGNPESRSREPSFAMFSIAKSLVRLFLLLTAFFFIFCEISLVPKFKTGITIAEGLAFEQNFFRSDPRGAYDALSRKVRRALLYGHNSVQQISSLAFGGRGVGLLHSLNGRKVVHVDFDQTKALIIAYGLWVGPISELVLN